MKPAVVVAVALVVLIPGARAARVEAGEFGVSLVAPDGWKQDPEDHFGFVLVDPKSPQKGRKIRIHFTEGKAATPKDQAAAALATINQKRKERGDPPEIIRYEKAVTTRSGLKGYLAAHGFAPEKTPYVNHYYFALPSGRIICVCIYLSRADAKTEAALEKQVLDTLELIPGASAKKNAAPGKPEWKLEPMADKPGLFTDQTGKVWDLRGFPSGTEVRDPYTDAVFVVP